MREDSKRHSHCLKLSLVSPFYLWLDCQVAIPIPEGRLTHTKANLQSSLLQYFSLRLGLILQGCGSGDDEVVVGEGDKCVTIC